MTEKAVIEERENGPLVVRGLESFIGPDGEALEAKPVMALCRCGGSASKPFCDGTHRKNGFESSVDDPAGKDTLLPYEGKQVTVLYNPRLCSHARECVRLSSMAFDPDRKPWVNPDAASVAEIEAVIRACPSGALQTESRGHLVPEGTYIQVERNGPYRVVRTELTARSAGEGASTEKMVLCRCGLSGNKPWCDGSHSDSGWKDR